MNRRTAAGGDLYVVNMGGSKSSVNISNQLSPNLDCAHYGAPAVCKRVGLGFDSYNQRTYREVCHTMHSATGLDNIPKAIITECQCFAEKRPEMPSAAPKTASTGFVAHPVDTPPCHTESSQMLHGCFHAHGNLQRRRLFATQSGSSKGEPNHMSRNVPSGEVAQSKATVLGGHHHREESGIGDGGYGVHLKRESSCTIQVWGGHPGQGCPTILIDGGNKREFK